MAVKHRHRAPGPAGARAPRPGWAQHQSAMFYVFPFINRVGIELRDYRRQRRTDAPPLIWTLRNWVWASAAPAFGYLVDRWCSRSRPALPRDRRRRSRPRRHPPRLAGGEDDCDGPDHPLSGSIRLAPVHVQPVGVSGRPATRPCCAPTPTFAGSTTAEHGYRSNLLTVGYRIKQDRSALLSYSFHGNVITIDPVSNGGPGWPEFLDAFNRFASAFGGVPLLNQTDRLTPTQAREALGQRLRIFTHARRRFDPHGRLLSPYFRSPAGRARRAAPGTDEALVGLAAGHRYPCLPATGLDEPPGSKGGDHQLRPDGELRRDGADPAQEKPTCWISCAGTRGGRSGSWAPDTPGATCARARTSPSICGRSREFAWRTTGGVPRSSRAPAARSPRCSARCAAGPDPTDARRHHPPDRGRRRGHGHAWVGRIEPEPLRVRDADRDVSSGHRGAVRADPSADSTDPTEHAELRAARCSLGCLGVVLSLRFECARRYAVEEELTLVPSSRVLARAEDYPLQQFVVIPYSCKYYVLGRRRIPDERARGPREWLKRMAYRGYKLGVVDVGIHAAIKLFAARSWDKKSRWLMERALPAVALSGWTFTDDSERIPDHSPRSLPARRDGDVRARRPPARGPRPRAGGPRIPSPPAALRYRKLPRAIEEPPRAGPRDHGRAGVERRIPEPLLHHLPARASRRCTDRHEQRGPRATTTASASSRTALGDPRFACYCRILARCLASLYGARPHWGKHFPRRTRP